MYCECDVTRRIVTMVRMTLVNVNVLVVCGIINWHHFSLAPG